MIPPADVAKAASNLGVPQRTIEKDYVLSWVLVAMARSNWRSRLAFKGGTAIKKVYWPSYRFSMDLDFTVTDNLAHHDVVKGMQLLFPWLERESNLLLQLREDRQGPSESTTLLVNSVGPLQGRLGSRYLKLDFTRNERLVYAVEDRHLTAAYRDYPSDVDFPTYSLEEILTEKLCALMTRRLARDLYDVHQLLESGEVDTEFLLEGFREKYEHKGEEASRLPSVLVQDAAKFESGWETGLADQMRELPDFSTVMRHVRRDVRALGLR